MSSRLLFVYGTLRPAAGTMMGKRLAGIARHMGAASTRATIYDLGSYPGIRAGSADDTWVRGDLYEMPLEIPAPDYDPTIADSWVWLDTYEGCSILDPEPREFCRSTIEVRTDDGEMVMASAYVLNAIPDGARVIISGDFLKPAS